MSSRYTDAELRAHCDAEPRRLVPEVSIEGLKLTDGYLPAEMRLAPGEEAGTGYNTCPHASSGCLAACLYWTPRFTMNSDGLNIQLASRIQNTRWFFRHTENFMHKLARDIAARRRDAAKMGLRLCVRLNCTSDILWERYPTRFRSTKDGLFEGSNVMEAFPDVQFHDYTKVPLRHRDTDIPNYHLTFSLSEDNAKDAREALELGFNVAVVFGGEEISSRRYAGPIVDEYTIDGLTVPVISGRKSYARFLDKKATPGYVVALDAKWRALADHTGFVKKIRVVQMLEADPATA